MKNAGCLSWILGSLFAVTAAGAEIDFPALNARARALASRPQGTEGGAVPEWLRQLTYDQMRRIEFDPKKTLWRAEGLPFETQFLHPGFVLDRTVKVSELIAGRVRPVPFSPDFFSYRGLETGAVPADMGFAGFRLLHPLSGADKPMEELGVFAGASYFRFLARGTAYGLSARGLALNTAEPEPEEFPRFTEFWIERPSAGAREVVILALLESESVVGAYRLAVTPGEVTTLGVKAALHFRRTPKVLGLAPLTSMFWRGENSNVRPDDFRPEVHDSDGLLIHTGAGEWIWRPLDNPHHLRVSSFADENPRAFGLLQRDRDFESYQDLEASYHLRPSTWVEPVGNWGRGGVRLVEIPTTSETEDNMVAFWTPEKTPGPGDSLEIEYRLHWFRDRIGPPGGFTRATRHGRSAIYEPGLHRFVVDFDGDRLRGLAAGDGEVEPVVTVGAGAGLHHATAQKNPINGTWRAAFTLKPDGAARPVELRCFLRRNGESLTETWSYLWQP